jgi:hypothetical protein
MRRCIYWLVVLLWFNVAEGQDQAMADEQDGPLLVIIGASYAADWGAPRLPGYRVRNVGIGGQETKDVLERFDRDVIAARPHAVVIWGHINNIYRAQNGDYVGAQQAAKSDYQAMLDRAKAEGIDVILATEVTLTEAMSWADRGIALVAPLLGKRSYADRINEHVRAVNDWLRAIARDRGLRVLDFESVLDDGSGFRRREFTREDGSHLSEAAYSVLTEHTVEALRAP